MTWEQYHYSSIIISTVFSCDNVRDEVINIQYNSIQSSMELLIEQGCKALES